MTAAHTAPAVSIILCTSSRAEHLRLTLESLRFVDAPAGGCELIVVDNASSDDTADVVKQCRLPQMNVRYVYEARRGKGYAYNSGMAAALGEVLLFTDDDLRFPANWITGMSEPILSGRADAVAGGVVLAPHLQRDWMTATHSGWLADTESIPSEEKLRMVGANMAFSRKVLEKVPQFDPELGPGATGFGDETLFTWQLLEEGFRLELKLDLCAEHHFEASRLTRESFLSAARKIGHSQAYVAYHWSHDTPHLALRHYAGPVLRLLLWRLKNPRKTDNITETELDLLQRFWFVRHFRQEQRRPRNYSKHGLVKRG